MYQSFQEIINIEKTSGKSFWEIVRDDDCKEMELTAQEAFQRMKEMYEAMQNADASYDPALSSASGLVGRDGAKIAAAREKDTLLCGPFLGLVMEKAIKMGESNACMKRIVAAPTAGSCGVLPAVFLSLEEAKGYPEEEMVKALYVSAGIGGIIAQRASVSGAAGGCQAEIGAASAMAAGGVAYLLGGDGDTIAHAAALAMKNLLGLACDPVAGLVEVPCVKRNVIGAVNALTSADLSNAGIRSKIPPDEVFDAMRSVGRMLPEDLKETGKGGLAATPTGIAFRDNLKTF
ncbi:MAG: L-serine ammonia-lyase, iron-sulfur-dependent, subunit alpha [Lachnospiraceae bacterium]|jgi:L-serine dehydratase|nr:L-serine ammonia-lyase, iron-sulfur-dependent, subunit alpha [Lachnospiraceae bacterium]